MDDIETRLFGTLLRQFRQRKRLTQLALAYKIGKRSRGSIQAWENSLFLPSDRETVLALASALDLSPGVTDVLLLAAHYPQEYQTQGTQFSPVQKEKSLSLADTYIYEQDTPLLDITLHNNGAKTVVPTRVQVDILDIGEFFYCDEEDEEDALTRIFTPPSRIYDVSLSPAFKGKQISAKIAHILHTDEVDRFQLKFGQSLMNDLLAYVWYYVKVTIVCSDSEVTIETDPLLLSLPPVDTDIADVWTGLHTPCTEQNNATLRRMSRLSAYRSPSVDTIIRQILHK